MQSVVPRIYERHVRQKLDKIPAMAILGPRQCGKTTLAQQFKNIYFDLEAEGSLPRLDAEWEATRTSRAAAVGTSPCWKASERTAL